jgi:hypothetical protein
MYCTPLLQQNKKKFNFIVKGEASTLTFTFLYNFVICIYLMMANGRNMSQNNKGT